MSITNKLNQIKNAIYGKEVRGAIHDAIKECYDDASVNHDNANMEVKMARGTHNTLSDRLDKSDEIQAQTNAQLSKKINKGEGGVITNAMLSQEVKEAMTGGSVAVVGKDTVLTENIIDGAVKRNKTDFYEFLTTGNLINPLNLLDNGYLNTGVTDSTMYGVRINQDQIDFMNGEIISYNIRGYATFWDASNNYISGQNLPNATYDYPYTINSIPTDTSYIIYSFSKNVASAHTNPVIANQKYYHKDLKPAYLDKQLKLNPSQLTDGINFLDIKDVKINPKGNLITELNVEHDYYYNVNGQLISSKGAHTIILTLEPNVKYRFNFDSHITFWNSSDKFISGYIQGSISGTNNVADLQNIPTEAVKCRMLLFDGDYKSGQAVLANINYFKDGGLQASYVIDKLTVENNNNESKNVIDNPLYGKTVVFLGDSWCAGNSEGVGGWASRIKANNPTTTVYNYGLHGADWNQCNLFILDNAEKMAQLEASDYIVIEAYTNGLYDNVADLTKSLGTVNEFTYLTLDQINALPESYAKDLEKALYRIIQGCHGKKVCVIFPYKSVAMLRENNAFRAFKPEVIKCCRKYNIPVFDNFDGCLIPSYDETLRANYYATDDQTHLNAKGYDVITPPIEAFIKTL